jgi:hypothetical protein
MYGNTVHVKCGADAFGVGKERGRFTTLREKKAKDGKPSVNRRVKGGHPAFECGIQD